MNKLLLILALSVFSASAFSMTATMYFERVDVVENATGERKTLLGERVIFDDLGSCMKYANNRGARGKDNAKRVKTNYANGTSATFEFEDEHLTIVAHCYDSEIYDY